MMKTALEDMGGVHTLATASFAIMCPVTINVLRAVGAPVPEMFV